MVVQFAPSASQRRHWYTNVVGEPLHVPLLVVSVLPSWGVPEIEPSLPVLGEALVEAITGQLEPVDFNPTFFQLTAGLAVRF